MSFTTRVTAAAASSGLLAAIALVCPTAAHADGYCSLVAPSAVSIDRPYKAITLRLAGDCAASRVDYASWDAYSYHGATDIAIFDKTTSDVWDVYDWDDLGQYQWRPSLAYTSDYDSVGQNTVSTWVRLASWTSLSGKRSGATVNLTVNVQRWSPSWRSKVQWGGKLALVQYKTKTAKTWSNLVWVRTNSAGKATLSRKLGSNYQFRVVVGTETNVWGSQTGAQSY